MPETTPAMTAGALGGSCDITCTKEARRDRCWCSACFLSFLFFPRLVMASECLLFFRVILPFTVKTLRKCPHRYTAGGVFPWWFHQVKLKINHHRNILQNIVKRNMDSPNFSSGFAQLSAIGQLKYFEFKPQSFLCQVHHPLFKLRQLQGWHVSSCGP